MVPVMKGRGFLAVITLRASAYFPFPHSSIYSGISWPMGHPPLHGAIKQSVRGTFLSIFLEGRGFMGLIWCISVFAPSERAFTLAVSMPVNSLYSQFSSFSAICVSLWYPPGLSMVVATVMGHMPASNILSILK